MTRVLVTIPVWNEEHFIEPCIRGLRNALATTGWDWRIAVAEDGSTDATKSVLRRLAAEFPDLLVVSGDARLGRGLALRRLWSDRTEDVFLFADADLASGPEAVLAAVEAVTQGHPVVTGSRYIEGAVVHRPPVRSLVSMGYNRLARFLFREGLRDHQCGLKAFDRQALSVLLPLTREDSWFWDTEILVLAARSGLSVTEVPVRWTEHKTERTEWRRLFRDVYLHGTRLLSLLGRIDSVSGEARRRLPAPDLPRSRLKLPQPTPAP